MSSPTFVYRVGLDVVGVAGLEYYVYDGVGPVFFDVFAQQREALAVGRHDGAWNGDVFLRQRVDGVAVLAHFVVRAFEVAAVFEADDERGAFGGFYRVYDFFKRFAHRAAGYQYAARRYVFAAQSCAVGFEHRVDELVDLCDARLVVEGEFQEVGDEHDLFAADHRDGQRGEVVEAKRRRVHPVAQRDRPADFLVRYLYAETLFKDFPEFEDFMLPELAAHFVLRVLRQLHDVRRAQLVEQLVHFLLSVAGRLAYDDVAEMEVRAGVRQREAVARLDERAEVARQVLFRRGYRLVARAAERDGDAARRVDQLPRREGAVCATSSHGVKVQYVPTTGTPASFSSFMRTGPLRTPSRISSSIASIFSILLITPLPFYFSFCSRSSSIRSAISPYPFVARLRGRSNGTSISSSTRPGCAVMTTILSAR